MVYGVRAWFRQLHYHLLFYRWYEARKQACGSDRPSELCAAFENARGPVARARKSMEMTVVDFVAHEMLSKPGSAEVISSKDVWGWVRQKAKLKGENVSAVVKDALAMAIDSGPVEKVDDA
eukprot:11410966-Alexandrium_andersonii.AAC.1